MAERKLEDELRQHVAKLKEDLAKEQAEHKETKRAKVAELKNAREREREAAKEQIEALKQKLMKEKRGELQTLRDQLNREKGTAIREVQHSKEEELQSARKEWQSRSKEELERSRREIHHYLHADLSHKFEADSKKLMRELFEAHQHNEGLEAKLSDAQAADRAKANEIIELNNQYKTELEKLNRDNRISSKKQTGEAEELQRKVVQLQQDLGHLQEKLLHSEADKDHWEEEVRRLRKGQSWARQSPRAALAGMGTPPTDEFSPSRRTHTEVERDMAIRNSELSYTVKRLQDLMTTQKGEKEELERQLSEQKRSLKPTEENISKLKKKLNDRNSLLSKREKQIEQLSQTEIHLKRDVQSLQEDHSRLSRSCQEQLSKGHVYRQQIEELKMQKNELQRANQELECSISSLREELVRARPLSISPLPRDRLEESLNGSQVSLLSEEQFSQLEFDKDELQAKYDEMKEEYGKLKRNYKQLRKQLNTSGHFKVQHTQKDIQLLQKEKLELEREVSLLKEGQGERSDSMDQQREQLLHQQLLDLQEKVDTLDKFIIEQDEQQETKEAAWKKDKEQLLQQQADVLSLKAELAELKGESTRSENERLEDLQASEQEKVCLSSSLAQLQGENDALERTVKPLQLTVDELQSKLEVALNQNTAMDAGKSVDDNATLETLLGMKEENLQLRSKNDELEGCLGAARQHVELLQASMLTLESSAQEQASEKDLVISALKKQVHQLQSKIIRVRRGVSGEDSVWTEQRGAVKPLTGSSPSQPAHPPSTPPPSTLPTAMAQSQSYPEEQPPLNKPRPSATPTPGETRLYVAVLDYDPRSLCTTGQPHKELALDTGSLVAVEGGLLEGGFYWAHYNGRAGLVPSSFIQEMELADPAMRHRLINQKLEFSTASVTTPRTASWH